MATIAKQIPFRLKIKLFWTKRLKNWKKFSVGTCQFLSFDFLHRNVPTCSFIQVSWSIFVQNFRNFVDYNFSVKYDPKCELFLWQLIWTYQIGKCYSINHMVLIVRIWFRNLEWNQKYHRKFFNSYSVLTDYGACCLLLPYLDFINPATKDLNATEYRAKDFLSMFHGAKNGLKHGLKVILDLESFDYAYFPRESEGFLVALTDSADQPVINQDGFYIAPGLY